MNISKILLVSLLLVASTSFAENLPPTKTFELSSNGFRMASSPVGTVGLKECEDCDFHRIRVTASTQYMIDGRRMKFEDFREALGRLERDGEFFINVTRDDRSGTVARIFIYSE